MCAVRFRVTMMGFESKLILQRLMLPLPIWRKRNPVGGKPRATPIRALVMLLWVTTRWEAPGSLKISAVAVLLSAARRDCSRAPAGKVKLQNVQTAALPRQASLALS